MRISMICRVWLGAFCIVSLPACVSVPPHGGFAEVRELVEPRLVDSTGLIQPGDDALRVLVRQWLDEPLTADKAVRIALVLNRGLQAEYQRLGIAQADLVAAGLLNNPGVRFQVRHADGPDKAEWDLELGLASLVLRPLKKRLAGEQFARTQLSVGVAVLDLAADTRNTYYELVAASQTQSLHEDIAAAARASAELAERFHSAGNIDELAVLRERDALADAEIALAQSRLLRQSLRSRLTRLIGLSPTDMWQSTSQLPDLPVERFVRGDLLATASRYRLDLAAARRAITELETAVDLDKRNRWVRDSEIGVTGERHDGESRIGPSVSIELPIFHQHQADVARAQAELQRARHDEAAMQAEAADQVTTAHAQLQAARSIAEQLEQIVIPGRRRTVELTQQQYNYMLTGAFELLHARQQEYRARQAYIDAKRDFWRAHNQLERAVGTNLPLSDAGESS